MQNSKDTRYDTAVAQLLGSGLPFALYRLPGEDDVRLIAQTDGEATTPTGSEDPRGFLYAPFCAAKCRPTVVIRPDAELSGWQSIADYAATLPQQRSRRSRLPQKASTLPASLDTLYQQNFERMMQQIRQGRFEKIVLSHSLHSTSVLLDEADRLFDVLTRAYPRNMVHLISTASTGIWIGSTPELLVERNGETWHTMALAGTKANNAAPWDDKNLNEQDIVRRYVAQTLTALGADYEADAHPQTIESGKLQHLRTAFRFRFTRPISTLDVARQLHPTPAVCGMPKAESYAFLTRHEHVARNYFAGYLGPVNMQGATHLYVNLRCAQLCPDATYFHAGSGLTIESKLEEERHEIDQKMQALQDLIDA